MKQFQADYNLNKRIGKNCSSRANSSNVNITTVSNSTTADTNTTINDEATFKITQSVSMNNSANENLTALSTCAFETEDKGTNHVAILRISQLKKEDEQYVHRLTITNELGTTFYAVRITNIEGEFEMFLANNRNN